MTLRRKALAKVNREVRAGLTTKETAAQVRNCYVKAIRFAKDAYWNNLFETTEPDGIWKTLKTARPRPAASLPELANTTTFEERCLALRTHFFPPAPPVNLVGQACEPPTPASAIEITIAIKRIPKASAAGGDGIPVSLWTTLHERHPAILVGIIN